LQYLQIQAVNLLYSFESSNVTSPVSLNLHEHRAMEYTLW